MAALGLIFPTLTPLNSAALFNSPMIFFDIPSTVLECSSVGF